MTNQISVTELKKLKSFVSLGDEQIQKISQCMVRRNYAPGQFIFLEGDESTGLWFILDGKVKIIKQSSSGRMQGLCLVDSGKCFGSCPLFDSGDSNPADAQALTDVTLAVIPRQRIQELIYANVSIATTLLQVYHDRMDLLARLGECLGTWTVGMRINDCLIAHAETLDNTLQVKLTHEDIATLVGTAREVVSRHLAELESINIIECNPNIVHLLELEALKSPCTAERSSADTV